MERDQIPFLVYRLMCDVLAEVDNRRAGVQDPILVLDHLRSKYLRRNGRASRIVRIRLRNEQPGINQQSFE